MARFLAQFAILVVGTIIMVVAIMPAGALIGTPVSTIRVEGTQRVERDTVLSYTLIKEGMIDDAELVDRSVKTLFSSGLFADVTIRREGEGLVIVVVENPIVNRVRYEGNSVINDENLGAESVLKARQIYTRAKVQDDVERFIELYRRSGRFAARIEPKVIQLPQNRVDLIFEITEGPVTGIRSVNFIGNRVFDDGRLREEVLTQESRWWRPFSSNDNFDPDRIAYDRELLRRFYLSKGYADFRVVSTTAELTRNGEEFFVTFNIEEGQRYTFGDARVATTLTSTDIAEFETKIVHHAGERYDSRKIDETVDALTKMVGELGFAFADVRPRAHRDKEEHIIRVEYVIEEGPRVYVERININGNTRTLDEVIRRELRLSEGDAFNRVLLNRSERAVRGLGFFADVEITETPGSSDDKTIIDVNVREQPTGELSFGVGYSSAESATVDLSVSERNFRGRGQRLRLQISGSSEVQRYVVGFTEPYFFNRDMSAGFTIFNSQAEYDESRGIISEESGLGLSLGFPLSEDGRLSLFFNVSNDELINNTLSGSINPGYSNLKQEVGYYYVIDKRDDFIEPTDGWNFSFGQDIAGPMGDISFLRTTLAANFYEELFEGYILHLRGTFGTIYDYKGGNVQYTDRFFRGGRSFRGFERNGVGPRQISTGYALGANRYLVGTAEISLPLGIPKEVGMRANAFIDYGWLGDTDVQASDDVADRFAFRATYGLSISWRSPFGPVRFDWARPIVKEDYDEPRFFRFSVGTVF
ncbi:MAG: outer membrane protein assembly factor BamA [Parvibaculales bacterium]